MFPRTAAATAEAHRILSLCLDERAPAGLLDFFADAHAIGKDAVAASFLEGMA